MSNDFLKKAKAIALGHAVADALGVPVEFKPRYIREQDPVKEMRGYGTYYVPQGTWSDDTSMSLCALDAIEDGKIDFDRVMQNFGKWYYNNEYNAVDDTFDIGVTCSMAISAYVNEKKPWQKCGLSDERSNGNGSLMRIYPFVLYTHSLDKSLEARLDIIEQASALTHAHERSKIACGIYAFVMWELLKAPSKLSVTEGLKNAHNYYHNHSQCVYYARLFNEIGSAEKAPLQADKIKSSGYVVDSLEAAIWCLLTTDSYEECVIKAVNLGEDTDTVGAIAGSLAGALYGYHCIPEKWLSVLKKRDYIEKLCDKAFGEAENG